MVLVSFGVYIYIHAHIMSSIIGLIGAPSTGDPPNAGFRVSWVSPKEGAPINPINLERQATRLLIGAPEDLAWGWRSVVPNFYLEDHGT